MGRRKNSCSINNVYKNENRLFVFLTAYVANGNAVVPFAASNIQVSLRSFVIGLAAHMKENDRDLSKANNNIITNDAINNTLFKPNSDNENRFMGFLSIYSANNNSIASSLNYNIQISLNTFLIVLLSYYREAIPQLYFRNNDEVLPNLINKYLERLFIIG